MHFRPLRTPGARSAPSKRWPPSMRWRPGLQFLGVVLCWFALTSSTNVAALTSKSPPAPPANEEAWTHPLSFAAEVTRPFEPPVHTPYGPGHRGIDLAGSVGQPVYAAGSGTVIYAGWLVDRNLISIRHSGAIHTTYEPVHPTVRRGQQVTRGQEIGRLAPGHEECTASSATCLHWGARDGDDYFDPLSLLNGARVRLLPWNS